jgi:ribosome assembly protein RRB1
LEDGNEMVDDDDDDDNNNNNATTNNKQTWRPGIDALPAGEELEYDPSAYELYHALSVEWPCLSFDIVRDSLGDNRQRYPLTMFAVIGSQADRSDKNKLTLLKISDLNKVQKEKNEGS